MLDIIDGRDLVLLFVMTWVSRFQIQLLTIQFFCFSSVTTQTIALQSAGVRPGTGQILVGPSGATGPRQQIVVASSGGQQRQIVMTTQGGGTPVRSGQILQVTPGGQQIVVSQSGLILNPQTKPQ